MDQIQINHVKVLEYSNPTEEEEGLINFMSLVNKAIEQEDRGMFQWLANQLFRGD